MNKKPDYFLLTIVAILIILGIIILAGVSAPYSQQRFGNTYYFLKHQIIYGLIPGLILGLIAFKINLNTLKKWSPYLFLANLILLILVFIPGLGLTLSGASRWLNLHFFSFQPSEFLKLTFILYLANWLSAHLFTVDLSTNKNKQKVYQIKADFKQIFLGFFAILGIISLILIAQPDISTLGIIAITALLMYFSIKTPLSHSLLLSFIGLAGLIVLIKTAAYRLNRILVFFNPDIDPMGIGYQLKQALIAIGSGGITGVGLGVGQQKFLPNVLLQPISDSIFAIFAEETGLLGSVFLIFLFLIFLWRGIKISKGAKNSFGQLTALGITVWLTFQAFLNIGAMIGIFPLTGVPLTFISYGGTALVASLIGIGILLNISRQTT
ncbi:MAG: peptidoglycan glycosyltransferase FtsW [Minisyncoccales bacterium]